MIGELRHKKNIRPSELSRRIGQSPQNFTKKMQIGTVSLKKC